MSISGYNSGLGSGDILYALRGSLSGLNDAQTRMDVVANNVANANTPGFTPQRVDSQALADGGVTTTVSTTSEPLDHSQRQAIFSQTDMATELTNMAVAKHAYQANTAVMKASNSAWKSLMKSV